MTWISSFNPIFLIFLLVLKKKYVRLKESALLNMLPASLVRWIWMEQQLMSSLFFFFSWRSEPVCVSECMPEELSILIPHIYNVYMQTSTSWWGFGFGALGQVQNISSRSGPTGLAYTCRSGSATIALSLLQHSLEMLFGSQASFASKRRSSYPNWFLTLEHLC